MKKSNQRNIHLGVVMAVLLLGLHTIIAYILTPVFDILFSDTILQNYIITDVVMTVIDILDIFAMSGGFALISVAVFMKKNKFAFLSIYALSVLFRRLSAILTTFLVNKTILIEDIIIAALNFVADIVLLLLFFIILSVIAYVYKKNQVSHSSGSALFDEKEEVINYTSLYPFTKLLNFKNPLQSALFSSSILLSIVKMITRVANLLIVPSDNILMTVIGFVCDAFIFVVAYAFSCFLISTLYSIYEKKARKTTSS